MLRTLQLAALLCVATSMAAGCAHLLEMPNKMAFSRDEYLTVQQIYLGWSHIGIAVIGALVFSAALAYFTRGEGSSFYFALAAAVFVALSLVVFFVYTNPANTATANWTTLPENWEALRRQWEYSHAVDAVLYFLALASLVLAVIARQR